MTRPDFAEYIFLFTVINAISTEMLHSHSHYIQLLNSNHINYTKDIQLRCGISITDSDSLPEIA